ncbi:MAG: NAD-dependent epimerase/dehydratase family protein, partial [bacterium]|nr:NAD-dependent epimerase/dehydratase family protein [bacterium]
EGHKITCMDNLLSGKKENIEGIGVEFIEHDIIEPFEWEGDVVYNMACPASPVFYQKYPLETLSTCSRGMRNVLDCALKNDAVVVQASTSEVYGDPREHPQKESYWGNVNPNGIRSCYDEGKRFAESLCMNYVRLSQLKVQLARIFNTYGTRMRLDDGRVVPNFTKQAIKGEPLTMYGDGLQTRSFCYIDDMVDGLIKLSAHKEYGSVVNLGNPTEYTMIEA